MQPPARRRGLEALIFVLGAAMPRVATAMRPLDTLDAAVIPRGGFQLELEPVSVAWVGDGTALALPSTAIAVGLTDRILLEGAAVHEIVWEDGALVDAQMRGGRLSLQGILRPGSLQSGSGPSVMGSLDMLLPTVAERDRPGLRGTLAVSGTLGTTQLFFDGSVAVLRLGEPVGSFGVGILGRSDRALQPVAEVRVSSESTAVARVGLLWTVGNQLWIDGAVASGHLGGTLLGDARIGLTWIVPT